MLQKTDGLIGEFKLMQKNIHLKVSLTVDWLLVLPRFSLSNLLSNNKTDYRVTKPSEENTADKLCKKL